MKWLLLLAVMAAADSDVNFQDIMDYDMNYWNGPNSGCDLERTSGAIMLLCTLPSANVTLKITTDGREMDIICEKNSTLVCQELQEAKQIIDNNILNIFDRKTINILSVKTCKISSESFACPLKLLNATGSSTLILESVDGSLESIHLDGLKGVKRIRMNRVAINTTDVPYATVSMLPTLKHFSITGGSLILKPNDIVLPTLTYLEFADGNLRALPKSAFNNTPNIVTLQLWANKIDYIDEDAFEGLTKLVNISLNSNRISHIPSGLFRYSPHVKGLFLYANQLEELNEGIFSGLYELTLVNIFDNRVPLTLKNRTFANLPSLSDLSLKSSYISDVPADIFENTTNIINLSLAGNRLIYLPEDLLLLKRLKKLDLYENTLKFLPDGLFSKLQSLEELVLTRNNLTNLTNGLFSNLDNLKILKLDRNFLEELNRKTFIGLKDLRELLLSRNQISYIEIGAFENMKSLEILSLSRNNLSIDENDYKTTEPIGNYSPLLHLVTLKSLDLSHNNISIICSDWRNFYNLDELNLSYNSIEELTDVDMDFATTTQVDVRHNKIQKFIPNKNIDSSPTFLMDYNPYNCDCKLYNFINLYKNNDNITKMVLKNSFCANPTNFRGQKLIELNPDSLICPVDCVTNEIIDPNITMHNICNCLVRPSQLRLEMTCNKVPKTYPRLPPGMNYAYLKLETPQHIDKLPPEIKIIDLSNLNLTQPPNLHSIEVNLTNNLLEEFPTKLLKQNCSLHLRNNPLVCSCDTKHDLEFVRNYKYRILDYKFIVCSNNLTLSNIDVTHLCTARNATITGSSLALLGVLLAVIACISYKYRTVLRIILRKCGFLKRPSNDEQYDAFVSYAHQDEDFVLNQLIPNLEKGRNPLKLCLHYRDWVVGDWIPEQIARSVESSHRTIIVLSEHFVISLWGKMEFRQAVLREKVIILMLDDFRETNNGLDADLKAYISLNTYIKASDPLVWERIKDAVLKRRKNDKLALKVLDVQLNSDGKLVNRALKAPV